jgi:hypothetical protein
MRVRSRAREQQTVCANGQFPGWNRSFAHIVAPPAEFTVTCRTQPTVIPARSSA